jgi:hypothetical protein
VFPAARHQKCCINLKSHSIQGVFPTPSYILQAPGIKELPLGSFGLNYSVPIFQDWAKSEQKRNYPISTYAIKLLCRM